MFETDKLPDGWSQRINYMDEVWVPTEEARRIFTHGGVDPQKIKVLGEAVDTSFYRPHTIESIQSSSALQGVPEGLFIFLFVGKFEARKGIDILLRAYFDEFSKEDSVLLVILTSAYHSAEDVGGEIQRLLKENGIAVSASSPRYFVLKNIPSQDMPMLYSKSDVLVRTLPINHAMKI